MRSALLALSLVSALTPASGARGEPARIASLVPAASAAVEAVAGPHVLVATARRSLRVAPRAGVLDLGNPHAPDLEALVSARPTLILADRDRQARMLPPSLSAKAFWLELSGVDATLRSLDALGARIGAATKMETRTRAVRARISALRASRQVRALALFGTPGQFQVITRRHWLGDLLAELGATCIEPAASADALGSSIVPLNDEAAASIAADLVVVVAHGEPRAVRAALTERLATGGAWSGIASARGGIHALDAERFGANPGLALGDAAEELARLLEGAAR
jgi:iron complex transport system substrate-binding protein